MCSKLLGLLQSVVWQNTNRSSPGLNLVSGTCQQLICLLIPLPTQNFCPPTPNSQCCPKPYALRPLSTGRLETWLSTEEHLLLHQRTRILEPSTDMVAQNSPVPGDPVPQCPLQPLSTAGTRYAYVVQTDMRVHKIKIFKVSH